MRIIKVFVERMRMPLVWRERRDRPRERMKEEKRILRANILAALSRLHYHCSSRTIPLGFRHRECVCVCVCVRARTLVCSLEIPNW